MKVETSVGDKILSDGDTVYEHEYIKYDVKLKNNSNNKIENINLIGNIPEGTVYVNCYFGEISFENFTGYDLYKIEEDPSKTQYNELINLEAGEEKNISYYVRANYLNSGETEKNIESKIMLMAQ